MTQDTELDLDAIEANARHWDHLVRDDSETTLALVAEVRRLRAESEQIFALVDRWDVESKERGPDDKVFTDGVVTMLRRVAGRDDAGVSR